VMSMMGAVIWNEPDKRGEWVKTADAQLRRSAVPL
jgi:hypothetical protein